MKRHLVALLFSLFIVYVYCQNGITTSELAAAIQDIIDQPQYDRMEWGILVDVENTDGSYTTIYSQNPDQYFTPASNNKVVTTAPAYLYFGDNFKYNSPFIADSAVSKNLNQACFLGRGDPSIELDQLEQFADVISKQGVESINQVTYDDSYFPMFPGAWEWEDIQYPYGAQPNSLILSQNAVTITVSPGASPNDPVIYNFETAADTACMGVVNHGVTISSSTSVNKPLEVFYRLGDNRIYIEGQLQASSSAKSFDFAVFQPAERFQCVFNYYLNQRNITLNQSQVGQCKNDSSWSTIATFTSEYALIDTMNYTLQESDNLFAECFLRTLGAFYNKPEGVDAATNGIAAVRNILASQGVDVSTFVQDDGSGLSRHNLVSPRAMALILEMMGNSPNGSTYRSFLPVAGESGTLSSRFVGTPAQGIVEAKTGTMSGVSSLSGYVDASENYPQIVFSILTNFSDQSASVVRVGIDDIVILLTQLIN